MHDWCCVDPSGFGPDLLCFQCSGFTLPVLRQTVKSLGLDEGQRDTALLVLASIAIGAREAAIHKLTGLSREFIGPRAKRLMENGVWSKGRCLIDSGVDLDNPNEFQIMIILYALCADGEIVATKVTKPESPGLSGGRVER